jgi:hypothetical protein
MAHLTLIFIISALPIPLLLLGESLARRSKGGPFKRFWKKYIMDKT